MDVFQEARKERDDFDDLMAACDIAKLAVSKDESVPSYSSKEKQSAAEKELAPIASSYVPSIARMETKATPSNTDNLSQSVPTIASGGEIVKDDNGFIFYKCRFCGLTFNFMNTLRAHERIHNVSQPYVCGKCNESFEFACQLEYHSAQHSDVDGFKCDCGRTFFSYTEMLYHKHTDDPLDSIKPASQEVIVPVIVSPLPGPTLSDLPTPAFAMEGYEPKHPLKVYSDVRSKPYICEYCSKSYADSRGLAYHMYSHRGERQFNPRASRYLIGREGVGYTDARNYYLFPRTSGYTPRL
ncbi:unnamed protein product [Caenorhabditis auriculariae]|uniref:Zinc finger protein unc-98 n=1 Tax=Caenorhabditis auriculariae TaxID=2777116 RepID=A0A8S1H1E7_9PELO|nr:unnamed protein product [Caenorhabditis auriculariae]